VQEQHIHAITGDTAMLTPKAKLSANTKTKLALATAIAALWMTTVSLAGAVAAESGRQISAARAAAIHEWPGDIRNTTGEIPKFINTVPAWPDMANKNMKLIANRNDAIQETAGHGSRNFGRI
jgi:hypothetical protein